jgi:hypothetical protein
MQRALLLHTQSKPKPTKPLLLDSPYISTALLILDDDDALALSLQRLKIYPDVLTCMSEYPVPDSIVFRLGDYSALLVSQGLNYFVTMMLATRNGVFLPGTGPLIGD